MRVSCPSCAAAYEVPDRLIGTGRRLRCSRCGHDWLVEPPAEGAPGAAADPAPAAAGAPTDPDAAAPPPGREPPPPIAAAAQPPAPRRAPQVIDPPLPRLGDAPPRSGRRLALAWAATAVAVLALVGVLALFREEITSAWPPAARLYLALGLGART